MILRIRRFAKTKVKCVEKAVPQRLALAPARALVFLRDLEVEFAEAATAQDG